MNARTLTRRFITVLAALTALIALPWAAQAQNDLFVRGGPNFKPVVIAVTTFSGEGDSGAKLTAIITNNFKHSVFLSPVDPKSFPEQIANPDQPPQLDLWKTVNAQYVVTGRTSRGPDGRLGTEFRLWDVTTGQQVSGQRYATDANNARRVAHIVSDAVFTQVTGEKGWFDSRVVFVDETGPKERRKKKLAIMDQDGANVRYLTRGDDLVIKIGRAHV